MKKKVFRERNWQEIIDAAAKADDEVKHGKKVKIERVGKTATKKKVGK